MLNYTRTLVGRAALFLISSAVLLAGCSGGGDSDTDSETAQPSSKSQAAKPESNKTQDQDTLPDSKIALQNPQQSKQADPSQGDNKKENDVAKSDSSSKTDPNRVVGENVTLPPDLVEIDEARISSCGIRKIEGKFLTVYTDIRDSAEIEDYPKVFEQAIPFWARYFSVEKDQVDAWKMIVFVIADKDAFVKAQLLTDRLPAFATGYQSGRMMWVFKQEGDYYTRHLLLHEGTHGFMERFLGGYGPPWYAEGMAELLAVHRWQNHQLEMQYRLRDRSEAENWGRVRIIQDDTKEEKALSLEQAMLFESREFFNASRPYAWSWAVCYFLSQHPLSKDAFAAMQKKARDRSRQFTLSLLKELGDETFQQLAREWQLFIDEMEYGYDVEAAAMVDVEAMVDTVGNKWLLTIDPRRGWHRTELIVKKGHSYTFRASGDFKVADLEVEGKREIWNCRPNGITIEYHRGKPLGMVLSAVDSVDAGGKTDLLNSVPSFETGYVPKSEGRLCFRINESPARLGDNSGKIQIEIRVNGPLPKK